MPVDVSGLGSPVAVITLNTPSRLNAFGRQDLRDLGSALDRCESDRDVRCLVIRGTGRAFCAGADLGFVEEIRQAPAQAKRIDLALAPAAVRRIAFFGKPTIAAVHGAAFGGGACVALACDEVILAMNARLGLIFTSLGLPGGDSLATWLLSRRTGTRRAWRLLARGAVVAAAEALHLGLADEVVPEDQLAEIAHTRAAAYASRPPAAMATTKRQALRLEGAGSFLEAALEQESAEMLTAFAGPELAEGLAAYREKRDPRWPAPETG